MAAPLTPPGPPDSGALGKLATGVRFLIDAPGTVHERFERYGDLYRVRGRPDLFAMRHPDHLYQVLVEQASAFEKKHTAFERLSRVLGNGLLTSDGEVWRRHRRMIQPAFAHARLLGYADVMRDEAELLARSWHDGGRVDMGAEMMKLTLAIVCRTLFSHSAEGQADGVSQAMAALQDTASRPDLLPAWFPDPARARADRAIATLDDIVLGLIRQRREQRERQPGVHDDLLERLLAAEDEDGARFGEREIRDELTTLFLAGHETTAQALTWTWYLLARHPEAEAQLHQELQSVLVGRAPCFADLERLPVTEQIIDEAMRLYPPVYLVARRAAVDVRIGDYEVPAGSEVVMWSYWTHRDPRWFPEPLAFRPERFAGDARARLPRCAYLPFGAGPRMCVGKVFATIEAKVLLATLAQHFRAELASKRPMGIKPRVTLTPARPMSMRLSRRG